MRWRPGQSAIAWRRVVDQQPGKPACPEEKASATRGRYREFHMTACVPPGSGTPEGREGAVSKTAETNYQGVWDSRIGFGEKSAIIVIDFLQGYTTEGAPLYAPGVVRAVKETPELLDLARKKRVPILHTQVRYTPPAFLDGGVWIKKAPVLECLVEGNQYAEFCKEVHPHDGEVIVTKQYASAFFGTSLAATLGAAGVDTLIITGCTTSGCIRATAVDAVQHGFRTIVVRDCVGDRHDDPHEANLFDINAKYGDVVMKSEVMEYLGGLS